jgi:hypothetical protein
MSTHPYERAVFAFYPNQAAAEDAVHALQQAGIPPQRISVIGKDWQANEALQGHWTLPRSEERGLVHEGEREAFWLGGLFGLLEGFGFFLVPGLGPLAILGPLAGFLTGGAFGGMMGKLFGDLAFEDVSAQYRQRLLAGEFLVAVISAKEEEPTIRRKISDTHPLEIESVPLEEKEAAR